MKKFAIATATALLLTTAAFAQSGGDNPGGRGVTSTGGPQGVTGKNTDGTRAAPVGTTGQGGMRATGGNAALSGNNGNSGSGDNSLGHIKGGNLGGGK
jgi:hypothetical protein